MGMVMIAAVAVGMVTIVAARMDMVMPRWTW